MMKVIGKLFYCYRGIHFRQRGRVRHNGDQWVSRCKYCNRKMGKNYDGKWVIIDDGAP